MKGAQKGKPFGYVCSICGEQIYDNQLTEHSDDGLIHAECEATEMTDNEIRIAMAEACGAKVVGYQEDGSPITDWPDGCRMFGFEVGFPNYPGDLNAMHEAYLSLDDLKKREFNKQLFILCEKATHPKSEGPYNATARQRSEAFLRTFGKWKE